MTVGLVAVVLGGILRQRRDGFDVASTIIAVAVIVLLAGAVIWAQARARTKRRAQVAAACPGADLWEGWTGAGFGGQLRVERPDGQDQRGLSHQIALTLAISAGGLQVWRSRRDHPLAAWSWQEIGVLDVGQVRQGNTIRPALIIETRRGAALPVVLARTTTGSWLPASKRTTISLVATRRGHLYRATR
jgi:hypothetical protein